MIRHIGQAQELRGLGLVIVGAPAAVVFLFTFAGEEGWAFLSSLVVISYVVLRGSAHDRFDRPHDSPPKRFGRWPWFMWPRDGSSFLAWLIMFSFWAWIAVFTRLQSDDAKYVQEAMLASAAFAIAAAILGGYLLLTASNHEQTEGADLGNSLLALPCVLYSDQADVQRNLETALLRRHKRQLVISRELGSNGEPARTVSLAPGSDQSSIDDISLTLADPEATSRVSGALARTLDTCSPSQLEQAEHWTEGARTALDRADGDVRKLAENLLQGSESFVYSSDQAKVLPRLGCALEACLGTEAALQALLARPADPAEPFALRLSPGRRNTFAEIFLAGVVSVLREWGPYDEPDLATPASIVLDTPSFRSGESQVPYPAIQAMLTAQRGPGRHGDAPSITVAVWVANETGALTLLKAHDYTQMIGRQSGTLSQEFEAAFPVYSVWTADSADDGQATKTGKQKALVTSQCLQKLAHGRLWCISQLQALSPSTGTADEPPACLRVRTGENGEFCVSGVAISAPEDQASENQR